LNGVEAGKVLIASDAFHKNHETVKQAGNYLFISKCWLFHGVLKHREIGLAGRASLDSLA
jgi:hypothetical protein